MNYLYDKMKLKNNYERGRFMPKKYLLVTLLFIVGFVFAQTKLNESFTSTTFPPTGWTVYNLDTQGGDTTHWGRNTAAPLTSPGCTYCKEHEPSPGTYPNNDWIVTPKLYPTAGACTLSFYYRDYCGAGCSLEVWVSRSGNVPDSFTNCPANGFKLLAFTGTNTTYKLKTVSLSAFVNQSVYVAWRYCGKISNRQGVYLDSIFGITFPTVDAGVQAVIAPDTVVAHGQIFPSTRVINNGALAASFWTRCVIETITGARIVYRDSVYISGLQKNTTITPTFTGVTFGDGFYRVRYTTLLTNDMIPANDTMSRGFRVIPAYHDAGVTTIFAPVDTVVYGSSIYPSVQVRNYGSDPEEKIPVKIIINNIQTGQTVYTGIDTVTSLPSLQNATCYARTSWTVTVGSFQVIAFTTLGTDQNRINDTCKVFTYCPLKDVAVDTIIRPDTIEIASAFYPQAQVKNYGYASATFYTRCEIETITGARTVYRDSVLVTNLFPNLPPFGLTFGSVTLNPGSYRVKVTTLYNGDIEPGNNVKTRIFRVISPAYHDAGVTEIITPIGELQYNSSYTPSVQVRNFGNQNESNIPVTINIIQLPSTVVFTSTGSVSLTSFSTGTYTATSFWTATVGNYQIVSYTALPSDQNPYNDTSLASAQCSQKDVGVISITAPIDTVILPGSQTPQAQIKNFGQLQAIFYTRCEIESLPTHTVIYRDSIQTTLGAGLITPLAFRSIAFVGGSFNLKVITLLTDDGLRTNDTMIKIFRVIPLDYHDAGVSGIYRPMGELNYQQDYYPSVQVRNYGAQAESIPVTMQIANLQTNAIVHTYSRKIWLNPLASGTINDPTSWTTSVGVFQVYGYTTLDADADRTNDTCLAGALVSNIDAAVFSIDNPLEMVEPTTVVTPIAKVLNNSWKTQTFSITFNINDNSNYTDTKVITLGANKDTALAFAPWTAYPGSFALSCSTNLTSDMNLTNNRKTSIVFVPFRDVSATSIVDPDTIITPYTFIPRAMVFNHSNYSLTTPVEMVILDVGQNIIYRDTTNVDIIPTTAGVAYFQDWNDPEPGIYTVKVRALFSPDLDHSNDTISRRCVVRNRLIDVALGGISSPGPVVGREFPIVPKVTARNNGNVSVPFHVVTEISSVTSKTVYYVFISAAQLLAPGQQTQIYDSIWVPPLDGDFEITCNIDLLDDSLQNNTSDATFQVTSDVYRDVGVFMFGAPTREQTMGIISVFPMLHNSGNVYEQCSTSVVITKIGPAPLMQYNHTLAIADFAPHTTQGFTLDQWAPRDTGWYILTCNTILPGDMNATNNTYSETVHVYIPSIHGWQVKENISRPVKDGGALTSVPYSGIYAFPGNKTKYFYFYDINTNQWSTKAQLVPDASKVKIGKGAALCYDGANTIYAVSGNNTRLFWAYDITTDSWRQLDSVPAGTKRKKINGGTGLAYMSNGDSSFVYLAKGNTTREFYAYYIEGSTWLARESVPLGPNGIKVKSGSCITTDASSGGHNIYLLKATKNEFYKYDAITNHWSSLRDMTLLSPITQRTTYAKEGASMTFDGDNTIYAFKGGNTWEFWAYLVSSNDWVYTRNPVPPATSGKKIKNGAALTFTDGNAYALKGNNTLEFLEYIPSIQYTENYQPTRTSTQMAVETNINVHPVKIAITPNIVKGYARISYQVNNLEPLRIKMYNNNGELVKSVEKQLNMRTGIIAIDVDDLGAGVYFMQIENGNNKFLEKIVVQK